MILRTLPWQCVSSRHLVCVVSPVGGAFRLPVSFYWQIALVIFPTSKMTISLFKFLRLRSWFLYVYKKRLLTTWAVVAVRPVTVDTRIALRDRSELFIFSTSIFKRISFSFFLLALLLLDKTKFSVFQLVRYPGLSPWSNSCTESL